MNRLTTVLTIILVLSTFSISNATGPLEIEFVSFESYDLTQTPPAPLIIQGKLKLPRHNIFGRAVLILHGSKGVDARGDFYARVLNLVGIATLEIDMWEPRGVTGVDDRPAIPYLTYPDMFAALEFLVHYPGINQNRIGVIGFSWGGVMTMASATNIYNEEFNNPYRFAAHVANYPACYAYNNLPLPGVVFEDLTGAPLLIQIGTEDDYDLSPQPCFDLKASLLPEEQAIVNVNVYQDADHGFDGLLVPVSLYDPFGYQGAGGIIDLFPHVESAYESRKNVIRFFLRNL